MPGARGTWSQNGLLIGSGAQQEPRSIAALTNGQIPVGSTGYPPVPASITGAGGIAVSGGPGTVSLTTRGYVSTTAVGNVGGGEDTLQTWTMPADTLVAHSGFLLRSFVASNTNANAKTIKLYIGSSSLTLNPLNTAPNGMFFMIDLTVWYATSTSVYVAGVIFQAGVLSGFEQVVATTFSTGIDLAASNVVKCTGTATATDDLVQYNLACLAFRTP